MELKKPQLSEKSPYGRYGLRFNPFAVLDDLVKDDSRQAAYITRVYNREAQRVAAKLKEWVISGETSKLWIVKDMSVDAAHHIYFSGSLLRVMKNLHDFRVFPTVALLSLIYKTFTNGIQRAILDRLDAESYELCLFSYVYSSLEKLVESGLAEQALPGVDVPAFLKEIEESDGEILRKVLHPKEEDESSEQASGDALSEGHDAAGSGEAGGDSPEIGATGADAEKNGMRTEDSESDVAAEPQKGAEAIAVRDAELREAEDEENRRLRVLGDAIFRAVSINLEDSPFGYLGREVVSRGLVSLEDGLQFLQAGGPSTEALVDILRFISCYYHASFTLIDRIDAWEMLDDEERKRVYAEVGEWKWVIGDNGCLAIHAGPRFAEVTDESFLADAVKVHIDFHDLEREVDERFDSASAVELIADFLSAARPDGEEKSVHPFTEGAIDAMVERAEGDAIAIIDLAGKLIELSAEQNLGIVDEDLVKNQDL